MFCYNPFSNTYLQLINLDFKMDIKIKTAKNPPQNSGPLVFGVWWGLLINPLSKRFDLLGFFCVNWRRNCENGKTVK